MADDLADSDADEPSLPQRRDSGSTPPRSPSGRPGSGSGGGFFTIYKFGQGKWTRLASAGGGALIALLTVHFAYEQLPAWIPGIAGHKSALYGVLFGILVGFALLIWLLLNRPTNADFLIATDSEMKKVNWTSRKELIGSTKVVIIFMLLIAFFLFALDIFFGYFFYGIGVLKFKPFGA